MSVVGHPSQFLWRPACRLQFPQGYICNQRLVCWQRNYRKSVFWPAGDWTDWLLAWTPVRNSDNSDLLKTEIAYNSGNSRPWHEITAMAKTTVHGENDTVITAIVNSWFSYSPKHNNQHKQQNIKLVTFFCFSTYTDTVAIRRFKQNYTLNIPNRTRQIRSRNIRKVTLWKWGNTTSNTHQNRLKNFLLK